MFCGFIRCHLPTWDFLEKRDKDWDWNTTGMKISSVCSLCHSVHDDIKQLSQFQKFAVNIHRKNIYNACNTASMEISCIPISVSYLCLDLKRSRCTFSVWCYIIRHDILRHLVMTPQDSIILQDIIRFHHIATFWEQHYKTCNYKLCWHHNNGIIRHDIDITRETS